MLRVACACVLQVACTFFQVGQDGTEFKYRFGSDHWQKKLPNDAFVVFPELLISSWLPTLQVIFEKQVNCDLFPFNKAFSFVYAEYHIMALLDHSDL